MSLAYLFGVPWRWQDFTGDADLLEHHAAFGEWVRDIIVHRDVHVPITNLGPRFHARYRADLILEHEQWCARVFEFLGEAGVIHMVMGRKAEADLFKRNAHAIEARIHHSHLCRDTQDPQIAATYQCSQPSNW
jgi:hypothetical protein